jgi:hypothetical protein
MHCAAASDSRQLPRVYAGGGVWRTLAGITLLLGTQQSLAVDASEYLFTPTVTQGERELEFYGGSGSPGDYTHAESNAALGLGFGVTQHWFTELALAYRWQSPAGTGLDAIEWENTLQIGEPGQWPVDIGFVGNLEKPSGASANPAHKEGASIRFGPLLQKDIGKFEVNVNLLCRTFLQSTGMSSPQYSYQGQVKYRYGPPLEMGLQIFGRVSGGGQTWAPYQQQVLRVGPVLLGRLTLPRERSLAYNIGYLVGTTQHSPDQTLRMQVEYEF